ncbi:MAG TPA: hypothetical protein VIM75_00535 [Ohtaekwangia sp.]
MKSLIALTVKNKDVLTGIYFDRTKAWANGWATGPESFTTIDAYVMYKSWEKASCCMTASQRLTVRV